MNGAERRCRKCGCTEMAACVTDGIACSWIEEDLCSACVAPGLNIEPSDITALSCVPPIVIELDGVQSLILLSTVQVAMRHPDFEKQASAQSFISDFAHALALLVGVTPNLKIVCEAGWPQNEKAPTVRILPSDFGQ